MGKTAEELFEEAWTERLNEAETKFDPQKNLLYADMQGINYHTSVENGRVHKVRENAEYIPALFFRGKAADEERAHDILKSVLSMQDKDDAHETYGIWPYLFEEPLSGMKNPDWNWAAFIGRVLIVLLRDFPERLSEQEKTEIRDALRCACISIIRRNMGVDYTNISLMTGFVLSCSGEILRDRTFLERGKRTFEKQLDFIEKNGGYAEYNSPYYGVIDIEETGRALRYCRESTVIAPAEKLHRAAWKVFAEHYHYPTRQIAPPHARCYADIQDRRVSSLIEIGTNGKCRLTDQMEVDLMWRFDTFQCPAEFCPSFRPLSEPRTVRQKFYRGYDPIADEETRVLVEKGMPEISSCTYLHPEYCLGTFSRHDMWNQRRPLMAYFRTEHGVVCFRARCLHDGMDFSSAVMASVQSEGLVSGGISFVTDHGDYHYILTPLDHGKFDVSELSVRFTAEGALQDVTVTKLSDTAYRFQIGKQNVELSVPRAEFGGKTVTSDSFRTDREQGAEFVFYRGEKKKTDLNNIGASYLLYTLQVSGQEDLKPGASFEKTENGFCAVLQSENGALRSEEIRKIPCRYLPEFPGKKKQFYKGGFYYTDGKL